MKLILAARPPFSLPTVTRSHGWVQLAPYAIDESSGGFDYIDRLPDAKVAHYHVREAPDGVQVAVDPDLNLAEEQQARERLAWMLGLEQDFSDFYTLAKAEPKLQKAAARAQGRILRSPTLFEDVLKTILTTNTLWAATIRMDRNLVTQFGEPLPAEPSLQAFPTPERLAQTDETTLRQQTRLGYRAPYVLGLAQAVASGSLDLEALKDPGLSTADLRKALLAIKGIGPYAAANLLMLLGHYDDLPVDSWALKVVSYEWYDGQPVGRKEVEAAFEKWGAYKGLAYWMWDWSYYQTL
jgi:3-methyladenine DNA glycosylase/8-oxoguanine DNA glycosylase